MKSREIIIIRNGVHERAVVEYEAGKTALSVVLSNGLRKTHTASDLFESFGLLRADLKDIKFLCKGSKINVHPSGMSSHMSNGLVAYELTIGKPSGELVHIFTYEENDLTSDIQEQRDFCQRWAISVEE
ncbi:hypothetical protein [Pseudomonas sp. R5-89-07]|uniref:hypothetical protein n=1 Tax=Pseudomonas sp. R5-89-07 TaxID=658644 RepID=UPI000F5750C5|nr:hypothetical protein [Pseudomonas sp. R5-89-07]AZF04466.1 hypothetical protein C4J94_1684 [Pseudomonas sp. R5-89-07]